jgi:hypothetical protein
MLVTYYNIHQTFQQTMPKKIQLQKNQQKNTLNPTQITLDTPPGSPSTLTLDNFDEPIVTTLRVNSGCNERQRLEGNKAKSKLVKRKEYRVLLCYL